MRSAGISLKGVILVFFAAAAFYFASFWGIEHLRHRKGPWEIAFGSDAQGNAMLTINQPALKLANVRLVLHGERATNAPATVRFERVKTAAPFGRVIYEDLTSLPGVVTFDLFGHEVELLQSTIVADNKLIPWQSDMTVDLWPTNKPAIPPEPPKVRRR